MKYLDLRGNPISIPRDLLAPKSGEYFPSARPILDYYFRIQDPKKSTQIYEAKILIVGEGSSGKTSLANKLINANYQLKPEVEDTSTQGIDILQWEFTGRNQQTYKVNIWDFGGQEIYHQTHQFFLTERSLYLLVADSRKEDTDHYFWLQLIRLHGKDSPVLLMQNEKQNRTCNLNLRELRAEFEHLKTPQSINLADNRGLAEIKQTIQHSLEDLLPNGIPFPNSWLNVRYALENDGRNYISYGEYESICRLHKISDPQEMLDISDFLHRLGICLHFQKDAILRHRLILKPNWGTAAVYKILDNEKVKKELGQFCDADLDDIWRDPQYANMRYELLQLMKEFKVCYEIPHHKGNYIAPHLLQKGPPNYDWDNNQNLILRYRYKIFMPKGILSRFIVEMHQNIENVSEPNLALVWKYGVVLNRGNTRAEITERTHDREIRIRLSGSGQRDFLTIINNEFEKIHDRFENRLEYDTLIPCNCPICKTANEPYSYPLDELNRFVDNNQSNIQCYKSFELVNVRRLLDDSIDPDRDRKLHGIGDQQSPDKYGREYEDLINLATLAVSRPIINKAEANAMPQESKYTTNLQGANIANFANEVKDSARQQASHITQTSGASVAELLQLINNLRQTADQFPSDVREDITIDIDDVETEIQKPEKERSLPKLKKRLLALLTAATVIATPISGITDFTNNVLEIGSKLGIEHIKK